LSTLGPNAEMTIYRMPQYSPRTISM
jgi:hypothetical protein